MTDIDWLQQNLIQVFTLPTDAVDWLVTLYRTIQTIDDLVDEDLVGRGRLDILIWDVLVKMPQNQFFARYSNLLLSAVAVAILKWQASDEKERKNSVNEMSFVWRASYYDIVMLAILICHGPEFAKKNAVNVADLYGESFADYLREFKNA